MFDGNSLSHHIELPMSNPSEQPFPLFSKETDWGGYALDSIRIAFDMSMDGDAVVAVMMFIPEWFGIRTTPLEGLYDTVLECFDRSYGRPLLSET